MVMMHTQNALMLITNLVYQTNYNLEIIEVNPIVPRDLAEKRLVKPSNRLNSILVLVLLLNS